MLYYIDPGTGSMLFTILVGVMGAAIFALRGLWVKLRFMFSAGKMDKMNQKRIPLVIFAESKRYWNVFEPICDELEKRGQTVCYYTCSEDDPVFAKQYEHIRPEFIGVGNKAFAKLNILQADLILATTPGLDVYQWKRSKNVKYYAHIVHMPTDVSIYRLYGTDYYDAVLVAGDYQSAQLRGLESIRDIPVKELVPVGLPFFDVMKERLESAAPLGEHPVNVLLAPSWGESSILSRYGEKAIEALLSTGYHLIIRPHPQSFESEKELMERLMKKYPDGQQVEWNRDLDNFDVLRRSDILISDFSGVIFDYALVFDKPIIYADTSFDDSPYDAHWLNEEPWVFATLPKVGQQLTTENLPNIKALIDETMHEDHFGQAREQARAEAWANIGEGAACCADWIMNKLKELQAPKDSEADA